MEDVHEILVSRINKLCKEQGLTYYALAYKSAVPLPTLIHILEGNTQNPGVFTVLKICDGLNMTMAELFDIEEFRNRI